MPTTFPFSSCLQFQRLSWKENWTPGKPPSTQEKSAIIRFVFWQSESYRMSHTQNPILRWSTQSHGKSSKGGRAHFCGWDCPYYPPITRVLIVTQMNSADEAKSSSLQQNQRLHVPFHMSLQAFAVNIKWPSKQRKQSASPILAGRIFNSRSRKTSQTTIYVPEL